MIFGLFIMAYGCGGGGEEKKDKKDKKDLKTNIKKHRSNFGLNIRY